MTILQEFFDYLLLERGLTKLSAQSYLRDLEDFNRHLGGRDILDVGKQRILKYIESLRNRYSPGSCLRKISSMRSFYKFLAIVGYLKKDPLGYIGKVKSQKSIPKFLDQQDILKILKASKTNPKDALILNFLVLTGARISEILGLKRSDIDLEGKTLKVRGKGNKIRFIPLTGGLIKEFKDYLILIDGEKSKDGKGGLFNGVRREAFWHRLRKYAQKAKVDFPVHPHIFRHSLATIMLNNGASIRHVQEMLGHSNVSTTEIYTHVGKKELKGIYDDVFNSNGLGGLR